MAAVTIRTLADNKMHGIRRADGETVNVPPASLHEEEGFNIRRYDDAETQAHIEKFAEAYKNGTYVPPILVRVGDDQNLYILDGHCRRRGLLLAIQRGAEIPYVRCHAVKANDAERIEIMLNSGDGLKFKPLEVADGYKRLSRMNFSNAEIARRVSKSYTHVENMSMLANANVDLQQLVRDDRVSASAAIDLLREHGEKAGAVLLARLDKAAQHGKQRVTSGMLFSAPRLPAKAVGKVVERLALVEAALPADALERAANLPDDAEISVPVAVLRDLREVLVAVREGQAMKRGGDAPLLAVDDAAANETGVEVAGEHAGSAQADTDSLQEEPHQGGLAA